jgi:hypothetical protein
MPLHCSLDSASLAFARMKKSQTVTIVFSELNKLELNKTQSGTDETSPARSRDPSLPQFGEFPFNSRT